MTLSRSMRFVLILVFLAGLMPSWSLANDLPSRWTVIPLDAGDTPTGITLDPATLTPKVYGRRGGTLGFLYPTVELFEPLSGPQGSAEANAAGCGVLVGWSSAGAFGFQTHAVLVDPAAPPDQRVQDLGTLGDPEWFSSAEGLTCDTTGTITVVGYGDMLVGGLLVSMPVKWVGTLVNQTWVGTISVLPGLPGSVATGQARAINDAGVITGILANQCVVWPVSGGLTDCHPSGAAFSVGVDINNLGEVAVQSPFAGYVWSAATGAVPQPPLPGHDAVGVARLTDEGIVVGYSGIIPPCACPLEDVRAVLWQDNIGRDLNNSIAASGIVLQPALGITDTNVILALGTQDGVATPLLLVPDVPEREQRHGR